MRDFPFPCPSSVEKISAHFSGDASAVTVTNAVLAVVVDALIDHFKEAERKRDGEIAALNAKIAKLETALAEKAPIKYLGVHRPGATYSEGSLITRDGSLFHANKTTKETPGDGCQDWTLAVKHGRDGKDGRDAK